MKRTTGGGHRPHPRILAGCAALSALATLAMLFPTPAAAASSRCTVNGTSCTTGIVRANGQSHFIDVMVGASFYRGARWQLIDYDIGAVVATGRVDRNKVVVRRVSGLYGNYALNVTDSLYNAYGRIDNE